MRVSNPDRSPVRIHSRDTAPTPTGFAEIVSDDVPIFHCVLGRDLKLRIRVRGSRQLLICMHNKPSCIAALCGYNPNWSAFAIRSRNTAAIPSSVAEIFEDDLPVLHASYS